MLKRFIDNPKKKDDFLLTTNHLTEIANRIPSIKKYSAKTIDNLESMLNEITTENLHEKINPLIDYIFKTNINLHAISALSTNYKMSQNIYNNNPNFDMSRITEFNIFKQELSEAILNKKEYIISALKEQFVNKSRQKGNLFKNYIETIHNSTSTQNSFNQITCLFNKNLASYNLINSKENFVYIPTTDQDLTDFLTENSILSEEHKGRDFFARYKGYNFIGEAKEIQEEGGAQNNQFNDMQTFSNKTNLNEKTIHFGIIYGGCCLFKNRYQELVDQSNNIFTLSELTFELENCLDELIKNHLVNGVEKTTVLEGNAKRNNNYSI